MLIFLHFTFYLLLFTCHFATFYFLHFTFYLLFKNSIILCDCVFAKSLFAFI